ncbi:MAG: heme-binding protein [Clostridia bacterium]|nr:heme-binding protein [Clostridia bacterium]
MERINLSLAKTLSEAIRRLAEQKGMKIVVAVCDPSGAPVLSEVMDGAFIISYEVALKKSYTCVAVKMSTAALGKAVKAGGKLEGLHDDRLVFFGGGEPLYVGDKLVGGLGVSGGTVEEDTFLASFGAEFFKELTKNQ